MDESQIAQCILELVCAEAGKRDLKPLAVTVSHGAMLAVDKEALHEAFRLSARGTVCEGVSLVLRQIPLQIRCDSCGAEGIYELYAPHCPRCRSHNFHFLPDAPIVLEDIEFQEPASR
jgi:hydrogenase nickel insertion protein HypA